MNLNSLLNSFGEKIFNQIIEDTNPGDEFLLSIIDPVTFKTLMEETADFQQMEKALKNSAKSSNIYNIYIALSIATLQVYLIYDTELKDIDDSFYPKMMSYYPYLNEVSDVLNYFKNNQEEIWSKVKSAFAKKDRYLQIPPQKTGSGRYVQFPKSQQIIRWGQLVQYADLFLRERLEPNQILSLNEFCGKVYFDIYNKPKEEQDAIKKIVFSFYNKWDGRTSDEIKLQRYKTKDINHVQTKHKTSKSKITLDIYHGIILFFEDNKEITENDILNIFSNKNVIPFVLDGDYGDWIYTNKSLRTKDELLLLVKNNHKIHHDFLKCELSDYEMKYFKIFIFDTCDLDRFGLEIAKLANLELNKKEIYSIIGGIKASNNYNFQNNVLGCWYDFALPKVKVNMICSTIYLDSKLVNLENNIIDLSEYQLKPGEHSLKCKDISPAFFYIKQPDSKVKIDICSGWLISSNELRQVNNNEKPNIIGLNVINIHGGIGDSALRPFLSKIAFLEKRPLMQSLNSNIKLMEERRHYGF